MGTATAPSASSAAASSKEIPSNLSTMRLRTAVYGALVRACSVLSGKRAATTTTERQSGRMSCGWKPAGADPKRSTGAIPHRSAPNPNAFSLTAIACMVMSRHLLAPFPRWNLRLAGDAGLAQPAAGRAHVVGLEVRL